jgi:hypothetical protein
MANNIVDKIVEETGYDRCIVSAIVGLSYPLRQLLITFLNTYKAKFIAEKSKMIGKAKQADIVSEQVGNVLTAARAALAPVDSIINTIPIEQIVKSCPTVLEELKTIFDNSPAAIPSNTVTQALNIDEFDIFSGVTNYKSLRNKIDELSFRLQRSLSISDKANKLSSDIDRSISIIDKYLTILSKAQ